MNKRNFVGPNIFYHPKRFVFFLIEKKSKIFFETNFFRKDIENIFRDQKMFDFFLWKIQWTMKISKIRKFFTKHQHSNFHFHSLFHTKSFRKMFGLEKYFSMSFRKIFVSKKYFLEKYFLLLRSKICPGIQKSYLEQRAIVLKIRTARTKKKFPFSPQYCHKTLSIWIEFRGSSV